MTKKDYELVASVLSNTPRVEETSRVVLAHSLASAFEVANPRFKRDVFLRACGVSDAS